VTLLALLAVALADEPDPPAKELPPEEIDNVPRQLIALLGSGGYDLPTRQPFAALDVAFHHDGRTGFAFEGRVQAGWAFTDMRPLVRVEAGFMGVVPAKQIVRLGVVAGTDLFAAPYPAPLQVPGPPDASDYAALSFLPYGALVAEVGGLRSGPTRGWAAWAAGLRLGAGAGIGVDLTCGDVRLEDCGVTRVAFAGGITARIRFHEGAFLDLLAGPTTYLGVGYAF
jgi:hypothetical protein